MRGWGSSGAPAPDHELFGVVEQVFGSEALAGDRSIGAGLIRHSVVAGATEGLYDIRPSGNRHGDWRLLLKVLHLGEVNPRWPASPDPHDPMYWRREALFYASDLPGSFRGGLRTPKCHAIIERPNGQIALWLEFVTKPAAKPRPNQFWPGWHSYSYLGRWQLERYGVAARHLGRMQGPYLSGNDLPNYPVLSRGWLRSYVSRRGPDMAVLDSLSVDDSPITRETIRRTLVDEVKRVWNERERFLAALDDAPQTLCHGDFWPRNLFAESDSSTVAIDWAYTGIGAAGEDISNLLAVSILEMFVPSVHIIELERNIWTGYLMGLHDAGFTGDSGQIRLGFAASAAVKFPWMVSRMLEIAHDPREVDRFQKATGHPIENIFRSRVVMLEHLMMLADEARQLMNA